MLVTRNDYFSKIERTPDGKWMRFSYYPTPEQALASGFVADYYNSRQLLDSGHEILPITFETLTIGDELEDEYGEEFTVGSASGYGENRIIWLIDEDGEAKNPLSAKELEDYGYTIIQPTDSDSQESMIDVEGKKVSLSTVKAALKDYVG